MTTPQLSLKLLIDTKANRVLFAEAGKDVVDFLFSLLSMPVGSIIKLLTKERIAGCIGNLYKSVDNLDDTYIQSNQTKTVLLNATTAPSSPLKNTLFLIEASSTTAPKKIYMCTYNYGYYNENGDYSDCRSMYTDVPGTRCSICNNQMTAELRYVAPNAATVATATAAGESGGFVKGTVTYTLTDNLTVTPMSTISCITLLNKLRVKDVGSLEERTVTLGMKEALELLEASLSSTTALTDTFLGKKTAGQGDADGDFLKTAARDVDLK